MTIIDDLFKAVSEKLDIYTSFLNVGASEKAIHLIAEKTGLKVPPTLAQLLKRHNGEKKFLGFLGHGFLSSEEMIIRWQQNSDILKNKSFDEGERFYYQEELLTPNSFFSEKRLPFAHDGSGQYLSIDYNPGLKGKMGQIVYIPMGEPEPMSVIAGSFDEFIVFITDAINTGKLALADDREDYEEDEQHFAEIYFYETWKQDWTEIAEAYSPKG